MPGFFAIAVKLFKSFGYIGVSFALCVCWDSASSARKFYTLHTVPGKIQSKTTRQGHNQGCSL